MSRRLLVLLLLALASPVFADRLPMDVAVDRACARCSEIERRELLPGIAEYFFTLDVGPGEFDVIGLHRVVRESEPYEPDPGSKALLLAHGDVWNFRAAFLPTGDRGLPIFLAEEGVDVWGIDFRWTRVPQATADLSFLADWGIDLDAEDLRTAVATARAVRGLTGQGPKPLPVLGWSRGGQVGYAALAKETRLVPRNRHISAFIPVDIYVKTDRPELRAAACQRYAATAARIANGEHGESLGQLAGALGAFALAAPDAPSGIFAGLTNRQAALLVGIATFSFFPPGLAPVPEYHFHGGAWDEAGRPLGLSYTDESTFLAFLAAGSPWQPLRELAEGDAATCDGPEAPNVPWDDRLRAIRVPVLYVGAGGGFGAFGGYTVQQLASRDTSAVLVTLLHPAGRRWDVGHADIFHARNAPVWFWGHILDWLER